ncbi:MAG: TIGR00282 family metallophosphoesterase [Chthonomonas sp.]|nr:TIGR00282 family metallophosphoesterase [Chthonomonas sp.]
MTYRILFLGDIVGKRGRRAVAEFLPGLQEDYRPLFTIVNGENSAGGVGITPDICRELFKLNVDAITLGNHAFNKKEIIETFATDAPVVRPANMPPSAPGRGLTSVERDGILLHIMNVCGRVFLDGYDDPFACIDGLLAQCASPHRLLDFHAEATSEKIAMGYHCEGRVTAVLGTHTHVTTADETILEMGTAYITDVGMCGPRNSVLGMEREIILRKFRTSMPERFEVSDEPGCIAGVVIDVERDTGRAVAIERVRRESAG